MTGPHMTVTFLPVSSALALVATAALAYVLAHFLETWPAVLLVGLAVPAVVLGIGLYHAATAPDAPLRVIVIASLCVAAAASPVTLIVSRLAVKFARG